MAFEKKSKLDKEYLTTLDDLIDLLFERAFKREWTWERIAEESGVSANTVRNLGNKVTRLPHFRTLERIARCLGGHITFATKANKAIKVHWTPKLMGGRRKKAG